MYHTQTNNYIHVPLPFSLLCLDFLSSPVYLVNEGLRGKARWPCHVPCALAVPKRVVHGLLHERGVVQDALGGLFLAAVKVI